MFTVNRIDKDCNIFAILKEEERGELPTKVYGLLKVEGKNYATHTVSENGIAFGHITRDEIKECKSKAALEFFQVD